MFSEQRLPSVLPTLARTRLRLGLVSTAALLAGGLAAAAPRVELLAPRLEELTFTSAALDREMRLVVVRPETTSDSTPVLYFLHGRGRHRRTLIDDEASRKELLQAGCWIILPDGEDGWYSDTLAGNYASYLEEVMQVAETHYGLAPSAGHRAIAGWSMGGYGAVRFAQTHPDRFGLVAAVIGLLDFPRPATLPEGQNYAVPQDPFGVDPAGWVAFNPLAGVESLRGKSLLVITAKDAFDRTMNVRFCAALDAADIPHDYRVLPGGHTLAVVHAALPLVLDFVRRSAR